MGAVVVEAAPEAMEVAGHLEIAEAFKVASKTCTLEADGTNQLPWRSRKAFLGEGVFSA